MIKIHKKIIIEIIPVLLFFFLGQTTFLDLFIEKPFLKGTISNIKIIFNYLSVIYTFLLVAIEMNKLLYENENCKESRKYLFDRHKEEFLRLLVDKENDGTLCHTPKNISIRVFVKPRIFDRLVSIIKAKRIYNYLEIRNYDSLGARGKTDDLKFEICPNVQGLVGKCYNSKMVEYSWDLKKENSKVKYNMTQGQDEQTNDLRFCLCYPIKKRRKCCNGY